MSEGIQSRTNHTRLDPAFHFFAVPVTLITFISSIVRAVHHPSLHSIWMIVFYAAVVVTVMLTRIKPLKAQDRIIRLEERLRLMALAPEPLRARIGEITEAQLVALRFASDAELPALAQRAVDERLTSKQIKAAIRNWRPDNFRV